MFFKNENFVNFLKEINALKPGHQKNSIGRLFCYVNVIDDFLNETVDPGDYAALEFNLYRCQKKGSRKKCPHGPDCGPRSRPLGKKVKR